MDMPGAAPWGLAHERRPGIDKVPGLTSSCRGLQSGRFWRYAAAMAETFESALQTRADAMADACARCGKCVEVCPAVAPAGVTAEPVAVIGGVIDIMRGGEGNESARNWANGCLLHGDCIKACDYGVNPRFLVYMAKVEMARRYFPQGIREI